VPNTHRIASVRPSRCPEHAHIGGRFSTAGTSPEIAGQVDWTGAADREYAVTEITDIFLS